MKTFLFTSLVIFAAVPALADEPAPSNPTPPSVKAKKVCRADDATTGSIMAPKRICHTQDEWAAIDSANAKNNHAPPVAPPQVTMEPQYPH